MPVAGVDVPVDLLMLLMERVESAQLLADGDDEAVGERRYRENAEHAQEGEETELADPAPGPAGRRGLGAFSAQMHGRGGIVPGSFRSSGGIRPGR